MQYFYGMIFGIVQGLTEFLPVSSSGHLVILHRFLKIPISNEVSFDVTLHLATMIAVIWFFREDLYKLANSWLSSFKDIRRGIHDLSWLLLLATIPGALAGFFFEEMIDTAFRSPFSVAFMLVLVGILFIVVEKTGKQTENIGSINWKKALLIGCAQAIALIPGTSRSGITTITGMSLNLKREEAIRFSFLLSIPIIAGATLKELPYLLNTDMATAELQVLLIAFAFALISSVIAIKFLLRYAKNHSLSVFAYYRFILALVIIFSFL